MTTNEGSWFDLEPSSLRRFWKHMNALLAPRLKRPGHHLKNQTIENWTPQSYGVMSKSGKAIPNPHQTANVGTLGRLDIAASVMTMSRFRQAPRVKAFYHGHVLFQRI